MKKFFSIFLSVFLLFGVLAACGPDSSESSGSSNEENESATNEESEKPEKLVVWEDKDKGVALEPAIESFEKEHGIEVEFKELNMSEKMKEQFILDGPAGTGPDVLTLPHDQIGALAVQGHLAQLKVEDSVLDTFTESAVSSQYYDGKLYGLPKATETTVLFYNKDLMSEDQVPATMDELYTFSKDFTKDEKYGFLALYDNFYFAYSIIGGMGGYVFAEENGTLNPQELGLNNEGAVEAVKFMEKWHEEGLFPNGIIGENGGSTMTGLFNEGKAASIHTGPWDVQSMKDAGVNFGAITLPTLENGEHPKTFMGVKGWHVSAHSDNQEWATKLVEWLTNYENAKQRFELTNEIPPVKDLMEDPIIQEDEVAKAVAEQSKYSEPMPNIPQMGEVWKPIGDSLQTVLTGKSEPKEALDSAVEQIEQGIQTNHGQ
ncbi:extracellular solute-binding protein [Bacillus carboniphilus]|uniref:Maltodextrin-binding protein n=1 Tax=Bacillus carboniphilus TaxID=86663 RepID=A0ABY9JWP4_9BACI|nr:extracellular solute-binding protein [Bacillus carboniphilus]WLR42917.1 extracellular solute-binding protein [Bacillus carboniphilus]